jgi:hypothetical protein
VASHRLAQNLPQHWYSNSSCSAIHGVATQWLRPEGCTPGRVSDASIERMNCTPHTLHALHCIRGTYRAQVSPDRRYMYSLRGRCGFARVDIVCDIVMGGDCWDTYMYAPSVAHILQYPWVGYSPVFNCIEMTSTTAPPPRVARGRLAP